MIAQEQAQTMLLNAQKAPFEPGQMFQTPEFISNIPLPEYGYSSKEDWIRFNTDFFQRYMYWGQNFSWSALQSIHLKLVSSIRDGNFLKVSEEYNKALLQITVLMQKALIQLNSKRQTIPQQEAQSEREAETEKEKEKENGKEREREKGKVRENADTDDYIKVKQEEDEELFSVCESSYQNQGASNTNVAEASVENRQNIGNVHNRPNGQNGPKKETSEISTNTLKRRHNSSDSDSVAKTSHSGEALAEVVNNLEVEPESTSKLAEQQPNDRIPSNNAEIVETKVTHHSEEIDVSSATPSETPQTQNTQALNAPTDPRKTNYISLDWRKLIQQRYFIFAATIVCTTAYNFERRSINNRFYVMYINTCSKELIQAMIPEQIEIFLSEKRLVLSYYQITKLSKNNFFRTAFFEKANDPNFQISALFSKYPDLASSSSSYIPKWTESSNVSSDSLTAPQSSERFAEDLVVVIKAIELCLIMHAFSKTNKFQTRVKKLMACFERGSGSNHTGVGAGIVNGGGRASLNSNYQQQGGASSSSEASLSTLTEIVKRAEKIAKTAVTEYEL